MLSYFAAADQLHLDVLRCLAIGMDLGEWSHASRSAPTRLTQRPHTP